MFVGKNRGNGIRKRNAEGRRLLEFFYEKELCMANTWFYKADKRKITCSAGECETEIDIVLVEEKYGKYVGDVKMIQWELQLRLVVVDFDKKFLKKIVRKERIVKKGCES